LGDVLERAVVIVHARCGPGHVESRAIDRSYVAPANRLLDTPRSASCARPGRGRRRPAVFLVGCSGCRCRRCRPSERSFFDSARRPLPPSVDASAAAGGDPAAAAAGRVAGAGEAGARSARKVGAPPDVSGWRRLPPPGAAAPEHRSLLPGRGAAGGWRSASWPPPPPLRRPAGMVAWAPWDNRRRRDPNGRPPRARLVPQGRDVGTSGDPGARRDRTPSATGRSVSLSSPSGSPTSLTERRGECSRRGHLVELDAAAERRDR
jgi:hypothetical protein